MNESSNRLLRLMSKGQFNGGAEPSSMQCCSAQTQDSVRPQRLDQAVPRSGIGLNGML